MQMTIAQQLGELNARYQQVEKAAHFVMLARKMMLARGDLHQLVAEPKDSPALKAVLSDAQLRVAQRMKGAVAPIGRTDLGDYAAIRSAFLPSCAPFSSFE